MCFVQTIGVFDTVEFGWKQHIIPMSLNYDVKISDKMGLWTVIRQP